VDPRGVDLRSVSFPEVLTSQLNSAYLDRCFVALLKPSTARVGIKLHSRIYTAFASLLGS
jgi:hypothetical protein